MNRVGLVVRSVTLAGTGAAICSREISSGRTAVCGMWTIDVSD